MKIRENLLGLAFLSMFLVSIGCPMAMGNCNNEPTAPLIKVEQQIPVTAELPRIQVTSKEITCLGEAMYYEARGQGERGMTAVAAVVINRWKDNPRTICEVVYSPNQFAWTKTKHKLSEKYVWFDTYSLANQIIVKYNGGYFTDITQGAQYFDSGHIKRSKNFKKTFQVGSQTFYKVIHNGNIEGKEARV